MGCNAGATGGTFHGMKVKTSVTLSPELLAAIDRNCTGSAKRSAFLERAAWSEIQRREREEISARDIAIINANIERLNEEAMEVLEYQAAYGPEDDDDGAR